MFVVVVLSQSKGYVKHLSSTETASQREAHAGRRTTPTEEHASRCISLQYPKYTNVWNRMTSGMSDVSMDKDNLAS